MVSLVPLSRSTSSTSFKTSRTKPSDNPVAANSAIFDLTIGCPASARCVAVARVVAPHSGEMQSHPTKRFFTSNSLCNPRAESTIKPRLDAHQSPNWLETPRKPTRSDSNNKFATKIHPCFLPMRPLAIARLLFGGGRRVLVLSIDQCIGAIVGNHTDSIGYKHGQDGTKLWHWLDSREGSQQAGAGSSAMIALCHNQPTKQQAWHQPLVEVSPALLVRYNLATPTPAIQGIVLDNRITRCIIVRAIFSILLFVLFGRTMMIVWSRIVVDYTCCVYSRVHHKRQRWGHTNAATE
mmetsp:Transcript_25565/g.42521  ORF Transcript_25565/g.42521 Transcript_25565/m.42521 type:complete len:294 (-) Transcript_25565:35-916(-)